MLYCLTFISSTSLCVWVRACSCVCVKDILLCKVIRLLTWQVIDMILITGNLLTPSLNVTALHMRSCDCGVENQSQTTYYTKPATVYIVEILHWHNSEHNLDRNRCLLLPRDSFWTLKLTELLKQTHCSPWVPHWFPVHLSKKNCWKIKGPHYSCTR